MALRDRLRRSLPGPLRPIRPRSSGRMATTSEPPKPEAARQEGESPDTPKRVDLVVITGHSGAGKSEAIAAFEDSGYFCVDNLPPRMIGSLGELFRHPGSGVERAAVVSDVRGGEYFDDLINVLEELTATGLNPRVLFLEADESTLLDRYKETRRRHPLAPEGRITDGIRAERELLGALRERADVVMDTTDLTGATLRQRIAAEMLSREATAKLALTLLTFGFKNGPPREADMTLDVRFLPNPHYVDELRPLTGLDEKVRQHVEAGVEAGEFYGRLIPLLEFLIPAYVSEGKTHLTIAIGCTGGRHRSLTVADRIAREISDRDDVLVRQVHRDVDPD
jgi:RNase adapter protein RapZ